MENKEIIKGNYFWVVRSSDDEWVVESHDFDTLEECEKNIDDTLMYVCRGSVDIYVCLYKSEDDKREHVHYDTELVKTYEKRIER